MSSQGPPARSDPDPRPLSGRTAGAWVASATLAFSAFLLAEFSDRKFASEAYGPPTLYILSLAVALSLLHSLPLGALHLARRRFGARVAAVCLLVAGAYPAWAQAAFLTSGDRIAASAWAAPLRVGLAIALLGGLLGAWLWHAAGVTHASEERSRAVGKLGPRARLALWLAVGIAAAVVLVMIARKWHATYAYFATFVTTLVWLVLGTLLFRLIRPWARAQWAMIAAVGVVALAALAARAARTPAHSLGRSIVLRRCALVGPLDRRTSFRDDSYARFDLSGAADFECRPPTRPPDGPVPVPQEARRNVILITFDAFRREYLEKSVNGRPLTPSLRRFAQTSVEYRHAVTLYPATLMSVGAALTGLNSSQILFSPEVPKTLFQLTKDRFDTTIVSAPSIHWFSLPATQAYFFGDTEPRFDDGAVPQTRWFIGELEKARASSQRTIAWIHFFEPHGPWVAHEGLNFGKSYHQRYSSEIAYVDGFFGKLVDALDAGGWFDDSLVLVFADHGTTIGERNYWGHHVYLDAWLTDIPLFMRAPGVAPRLSRSLVDVRDVAATVLHFAGVSAPPEALGRSLLGPHAEAPDRFTVAEAFPIRGAEMFDLARRPVRGEAELRKQVDWVQGWSRNYLPKAAGITATHRLIVDRVTGSEELFERNPEDPANEREISAEQPEVLAEMRRRLIAWHAEQSERIYCRQKR